MGRMDQFCWSVWVFVEIPTLCIADVEVVETAEKSATFQGGNWPYALFF